MEPQDKEFFQALITTVNAKIEAMTELTNLKLEHQSAELKEIKEHVKMTNGRVTVLENKAHARDMFCARIQAAKNAGESEHQKKMNTHKFILQYIPTVLAVIISLMVFLKGQGILKEVRKNDLYMQRVDSNTYIYFRGEYSPVAREYWTDTTQIH